MYIWQLLASISVLFICQAGPDDTALTPFIAKSAPLARLSSAIAIQNGVYDENSLINDVISEFLDVSPNLISALLKMDFKSLSGLLQNYPKALNLVSVKVKNTDGLVDALNLLYAMKKHEPFLKPGALGDQTTHFEKTTVVMKNAELIGEKFVKTTEVNKSLTLLKSIMKTEGAKVTHAERTQVLQDLRTYLVNSKNQLVGIPNYEQDLKDYLNLKSLPGELKNFVELARIAGEYSTTFQQIDSHRTDLKEASRDSDKIIAAMKELQKHAKREIVSSTSILSDTFPKHPGKLLTSGLLNPKDLESVFVDLQSPWLREEVLNNRDVKPLVDGLSPLKPLLAKMDALNLVWKSINDNLTSRRTTTDLVKSISVVSGSGDKVLKVSGSSSPFTEVSNCIQPLQSIRNEPDKVMLDRIRDFADSIFNDSLIFVAQMKAIEKSDLQTTSANTQSLIDIARDIKSRSDDNETLAAWDEIRSSKAILNQIVPAYESILAALRTIPDTVFYEGKTLDYNVIRDVSKVFEGTNAESVMKCIQKSSIDNLVEMFKFIGQIEKMKAQTLQFKTANSYVTSVIKLQGDIQKMHNEVKSKKLSEEASTLKESPSFKNIRKTSEGIGKGVYSLRAVENVLKAEKSILVVANADLNVKTAVARMKDLDGSYDDGFRKNLTVAIGKVKGFEKSVKSKPHKSLVDVGRVYEEARKLGFKSKINSSFLEKVGDELVKNSDPKLQSIAKDFSVVGALDMDFAKHSSSFDSVSGLFDELKSELLGFLAEKQHPKKLAELTVDRKEEAEPPRSFTWLYVLLAIIFIFIVIFVGLDFYMKWQGFGSWRFQYVQISQEEYEKLKQNNKKNIRVVEEGRRWTRRKRVRKCPKWLKSLRRHVCTPFRRLWRCLKRTFGKKPKQNQEQKEAEDWGKRIRDRAAALQKDPEKKVEVKVQEEEEAVATPSRNDKAASTQDGTQENLRKLVEHVKKCEDLQRAAADPRLFPFKGNVYILKEPELPPPPTGPVPEVVLDTVQFCPAMNELWHVGSDVDDIELDEDYHMNPDSVSTEDSEDEEKSKRSKKSKKSKKSSKRKKSNKSGKASSSTPAASTSSSAASRAPSIAPIGPSAPPSVAPDVPNFPSAAPVLPSATSGPSSSSTAGPAVSKDGKKP